MVTPSYLVYLCIVLMSIVGVCFAAETDSTGLTPNTAISSVNPPLGSSPCYYYFSDFYNITSSPGISDTGSGTQVSFMGGTLTCTSSTASTSTACGCTQCGSSTTTTLSLCPGTYQIVASFLLYQASSTSLSPQLGIPTTPGSSTPTYTTVTLNPGIYNSQWYFITYNTITISSGGSNTLSSPYILDSSSGAPKFYLIGGQYTIFFLSA